ncbi:MAG: diaminopimelate epimerase [Eubacteriales bacterium]|nr:diaminopimelate epimerase [Eubacteriales bacterium]
MRFTKMQGAGNDYVYVDVTKKMIPNPEQTAIFISDRHFGIGSDGLILIAPSETADFQMIMYNADGSRGEMCGNGIRCVGKYVYDHHLTNQTVIRVETLAGIKTLKMTPGADGKIEKVRVSMGTPELTAAKVPVIASEETLIDKPIKVAGKEYTASCISMGNPHCVIFQEPDVRDMDLPAIGPNFENAPIFPKRVNTEFVNVLDRTHLRMRVWERGSGETLACGTGATAVGCAAALTGRTEDTVDIELLGGHLIIEYDRAHNEIYMTGPATEVFSGDIELPDFSA